MLTDRERLQIWDNFIQSGDTENIANNYAIAIEQAVLDKLSKQEPAGWALRYKDGSIGANIYRSQSEALSVPCFDVICDSDPIPIYAHPVPAQAAIDLNTNDRGEPYAIYLQLHDPDDSEVTQKADFTGDGITWCWERIHENDVRYVREDLACLSSARAEDAQAMPDAWRLTKQGQIKVGDVISLVVAGRRICTTAKEVLHPGTGAEEVIYNRKKNHYFITSMVLDGTSNHKDVFIMPK